MNPRLLLGSYLFLFICFSVFSFVFADPNLFLLSNSWFVSAQTWLWTEVLPNAVLRTSLTAGLLIALFANFVLIVHNWSALGLENRSRFWLFLCLLSLPLLCSYNAFSYDLFNYIFNAKMIVELGQNPHLHTALEFPQEPMLRFMNNTHTVAPYGYGWTAISLLPYVLGFGKFLLQFAAFKLFAFASLLGSLLLIETHSKKVSYRNLALFFLNPLILIEVISSGHNDLFMMIPALTAVYVSLNWQKKNWWNIPLVVVLLALSISIKFATLALLPFFIYLCIKPWLKRLDAHLKPYYFDLLSLALFVPLLTERSKQFLPWYLLWPAIFLPMIKTPFWRFVLLSFSLAALLRYVPWVYYLPWMSFHLDTSSVLDYQKLLTWTLPLFFLLIKGVLFLFNRKRAL